MTQMDEVNRASSRHWLYGFNVAVLVAVGLVIVAFALYLTSKFTWHKDVTSGQVHSLSGSTIKLLQDIDGRGLKFEVANLSEAGTKSWQETEDVLQEYAQRSRNVTVKDASETSLRELAETIRGRYAAELKPYEQTIGEFDKLAKDVSEFFKQEGANVGALAQKPGTKPEVVAEAAQFQGSFGTSLPDELGQVKKALKRATDADSPNWSKASSVVKSTVEELERQLTQFTDPAQLKGAIDPVLVTYFTGAKDRYTALHDEVRAYREKLDKLPPLKVQDVLDDLARGPLAVVLGPTTVKVLSHSDIYKSQRSADPNSETPGESFEGEQAVSSALLSMVRPEKVKVVFVGSAQMGTMGMHSDIADRLRAVNFEVLDWSPPGNPMGQESAAPPVPPASGKGVVWVVFPPEAPNQQMMMSGMFPNPKPLIDAVTAHMAAGGQVMFLAEASLGPMAMMGGGKYPFADLLKPFGVDVKSNLAVIQAVEQDGKKRPNPVVELERFPDTQITRPLDSLATLLRPLRAQTGGIMGVPTVVALAKPLPAGASAEVLMQTPNQSDYLGTANVSGEVKFDEATDYAAPVPLAVAAVRNKGEADKEQRVVVIGSTIFGSDTFLEMIVPVQKGDRIGAAYAVPGNGELFVNSVLWLAGYENMIAVSTKAGVALRIEMSEGALWGIRWGVLWAGGPLGALLAGAMVWFVRRK